MEEYDQSQLRGALTRLSAPVRNLPPDLSVLLVLNLSTVSVVASPSLADTPLRTVLGATFVLFVPGYAVVSALFPEAKERTGDMPRRSEDTPQWNVDGVERVLLSVGVSTVIAGLSGFGLYLARVQLRPLRVLVPLTVVSVVATTVAVRRRQRIPQEHRFRVPYQAWIAAGRAQFDGSSAALAVNAMLALSIVLACSALGLALLFPQDGEAFTEFYLLTEDEDGELHAADYPTEFEVDEPQTVHLAIGNHERRPRNYTVLVELHRMEGNDSSLTVVESERIASTDLRLRNNETAVEPVPVSPRMTGRQLRLTFLLYTESPPPDPGIENAYRQTHLWINVSTATPANSSSLSGRRASK